MNVTVRPTGDCGDVTQKLSGISIV